MEYKTLEHLFIDEYQQMKNRTFDLELKLHEMSYLNSKLMKALKHLVKLYTHDCCTDNDLVMILKEELGEDCFEFIELLDSLQQGEHHE
jgi:hypothetical protein